jgi:CcmD family protein
MSRFNLIRGLIIVGLISIMLIITPVFGQENNIADNIGSINNVQPEANLPFLFGAYSIAWLVFFGYVFYMSQKNRELRTEVQILRDKLADKGDIG